jgi:phthiodiolone/phenolphthiodiolone dimycocerosates ketoreductase
VVVALGDILLCQVFLEESGSVRMAKVKLGNAGVYFPPADNVLTGAQMADATGIDFSIFFDQLNLTIPRSMWVPELVKAAANFDIDCWMDPWVLAGSAAVVTEKVQLACVSDALRRRPANLAQLALSVDHMSKGRFMLCMGAGETKQFRPYGLERRRPFTHLQESIKIIKKLWASHDPVSYDGPIWKLEDAILSLNPYNVGQPPPIVVLGGPGRSIEIAGTHADGWASYFPACGDAEWFAGRRQELREFAERAGRDPDAQILMGMFLCVMEETDAAAEALCDNLALRWDAAVMMPSGASWHQWNPDNPPHPFGDEFHYARDLIPMEWSREDAVRIAQSVPPEIVAQSKFTGSPKTIANMIAPYIDAGMTHVLVANYGQLVTTGDFSDAVANVNLLAETMQSLRDYVGSGLAV